MFERFTAGARQIVIEARQQATELGHPLIGTEHLLLAMLADDGTAGEFLREAGLAADPVRSDIVRLVGATTPLLDAQDAAALRSIGIDADAVLARIEESFGPEALLPPAASRRGWFGRRQRSGRLSLRARKVLELALREALRFHSNEIASGHLLLGLLREGEGLGAQIMADAGVDLAALRHRTERAMRRSA